MQNFKEFAKSTQDSQIKGNEQLTELQKSIGFIKEKFKKEMRNNETER